MRGEIAGVPQALLDGVRLPTQADVKLRWPDGSVKHAILSFVLPRIPSNGTLKISFANQDGRAGYKELEFQGVRGTIDEIVQT
jgi:hypothetical protein